MKPIRIQRTRSRKQAVPENGLSVKYVGRPGIWGNPFKVVGDMIYINAEYRRKVSPPWVYLCMGNIDDCLRFYRAVVTGVADSTDFERMDANIDDVLYWVEHFAKLDINDLWGMNLSCWCKPGQPCHADMLLEIANQ